MVRGDPAAQRRAVDRALEAGVRYFDTAPGYGDGRSEEALGRVLRDRRRAAAGAVVGTKLRLDPAVAAAGGAGVARAVRESLAASLRRLGRERVDLFSCTTGSWRGQRSAAGAGRARPHRGPGDGPGGGRPAGGEGGRPDRAGGDHGHGRPGGRAPGAGIRRSRRRRRSTSTPSTPAPAGRAAGPGGGQDFEGLIDTAAQSGVGVIVIRPLAAGAVAGAPRATPTPAIPAGASPGSATRRTWPGPAPSGPGHGLGLEAPSSWPSALRWRRTGCPPC